MPALSIEQLASRTGEPVARLGAWLELGLLGAPARAGFGARDVERVRVVQLFLRHGFEPEAVARAMKTTVFARALAAYLESYFPADDCAWYTPLEAGAAAGLPPAVAGRLCDAIGFEPDEVLGAADVEMLQLCGAALAAGFPEEALLQFVRVGIDALARVAEAETRLFHFYVLERLAASGLTGGELARQSEARNAILAELPAPGVLYCRRRGRARAEREDLLLHLAQAATTPDPGEAPGQLVAAVLFIDLCGFTPLTAAMGDVKAAQVLERFGVLVREGVTHWRGRLVKQIGDAFMLVFLEPRSAVACALAIEARVASEPLFPAARAGVHWGPVLYREGDYVGASVNLAARAADAAAPRQVLVTAAVRKQIGPDPELELAPLGPRRLKGLAEELELFAARAAVAAPDAAAASAKALDPVCGMRLAPAEVAARLTRDGREHVFCSEECLRRFVTAPDRY